MIAVINGPNLNLLGKREPDIYGHETLAELNAWLIKRFESVRVCGDCSVSSNSDDAYYSDGVWLTFYQSNCEGEIVSKIQELGFNPEVTGIIINPGAYAHYSLAIRDAIAAVPVDVIEVHLSNIHAREDFRRVSVTAPACKAIISGCGKLGYALAVETLLNL